MRKLKTSQDSTPKCYLSTSEGQWRVINQGMPVCKDMPSREQALAAAKQVAVTPTALWDGDEGAFKSLDAQDSCDGEPSPGAARLSAGCEDVYIVDADGVEVVDAEIEVAEMAVRRQTQGA